MSDKPFVADDAEACNIGVLRESQPITVDVTLCPSLMCDIVSVFDVSFRCRFHVKKRAPMSDVKTP
jgi:hypothetical protein